MICRGSAHRGAVETAALKCKWSPGGPFSFRKSGTRLLAHPVQEVDELSPGALAELVRTSGWRFDHAVVSRNGATCRVVDLYAEAMALLTTASPEAKQQAAELFAAILAQAPEFAEGHFQLARLRLEAG